MKIDVILSTDDGSATLRAPDRVAIQAIKTAPPSLRSYYPRTKLWTIRAVAWPAVHQLLVDKGYTVDPHGRDQR